MAYNEEQIDKEILLAKKRAEKAKPTRVIAILTKVIYDVCHLVSYGDTGLHLHPYQDNLANRIIKSLLLNDGNKITALFSRQGGKTETVSFLASGLVIVLPKLAQYPELVALCPALGAFKGGFWVGVFAPVLDQAQTLFRRIRGRLTSKQAKAVLNDPEINQTVETANGAQIILSNGSLVECRSASPTAQIESKTYHLGIIDESQDVESGKLRKSISPMMASTNGTIVMSGTCNTIKSYFFEQIQKNKYAMRHGVGDINHFEYDYRVVEQYNPRYKQYIESEKASYGEDSDEFRLSYRLEWIFERGMFTSMHILEEKVLNPQYAVEDWQKFRGWSPIGGIDFGKSQDSTVFTYGVANFTRPMILAGDLIAYRCAVLGWLEISGDDWNSQFFQIMDQINAMPPLARLVCDKTGVGAGIVDRLRANLPYIDIEEFDFNSMKSDGYKHFSVSISRGHFWVPYHTSSRNNPNFKHFRDEILNLEKEFRGDKMMVHAPDGRNSHDDFGDSGMMFNWAARLPPVMEFEMSDFNPYADKGPNELLSAR